MGITFMYMYHKHGKTGNCREDEYRGKWITGGEGRERERERERDRVEPDTYKCIVCVHVLG